ncbi:MAG: transposase [Candidatus Hydrogenedentota bacterium]
MIDRRHPETYRTYGQGRSVRLDQATYSVPGTIYSVTVCCDKRQRDLAHSEVARLVMDTWHEVTAARGYRLWALCIMPDHLHALLELWGQDKNVASGLVPDGIEAKTPRIPRAAEPGVTPEKKKSNTASGREPHKEPQTERHESIGIYSLGDVVREVKGRSLLRVRGIGRVRWQARFYDHVVRNWEDPAKIARYMVNNPVRAEMIEDWAQWPWTYVDPDLIL